jgi:hypothetical protein
MDSIAKRDVSSGGASPTTFMAGSTRDPLLDVGTESVHLGWYHELASGGRIAHHLMYEPETGFTPRYSEELVLRILCHYLVDSVPDQGLLELTDSISSLAKYYQPPRHSVLLVPERKQLRAARGKAFDSPTFHVEPE